MGAAIAAADGLHFGSIDLIAQPSRATTLHAVALAGTGGLTISYDPDLRPALWPSPGVAREGLRLGFEHAAIVKLSEEEVRFLTGEADLVTGVRAPWQGQPGW